MTSVRRINFLFLALTAALFFGACGASAETITPTETAAGAEAAAPATEPTAASETGATETAASETGATETTAVTQPASTAVVTLGNEQYTFDLWQCGAFGTQAMYATGLDADDATSGTEFSVSYELPMVGDGENAEYVNTVSLQFGNDTWKAGTSTNSVAEESWGELDWTLDGETLIGTATMVHSWGLDAENSDPQPATFAVNC